MIRIILIIAACQWWHGKVKMEKVVTCLSYPKVYYLCIVLAHVLFYNLGVTVYSTPIAKMSRITEQIVSSLIIGELLLNIIQ